MTVDQDKVNQFRAVFEESLRDIAERTPEEERCLILSGGVDTCAILQAASMLGIKFQAAFTVVTGDGDVSHDRGYSEAAAKQHNLKHFLIHLTAEQLVETHLPPCIKLLKIFDGMTLRNSLVVAAAFKKASEEGYKHALVGDGADELFGGYSFMWHQEGDEWKTKRDAMCAKWTFATQQLANAVGLTSHSPYTEQKTVDWAIANTTKEECIGTEPIQLVYGGPKEMHLTGKLILREAYETVSSWRRKEPIEVGSGATVIGHDPFWADIISDEEFQKETESLKARGYIVKTKENLNNFRIFEEEFALEGGIGSGTHPKKRYPLGEGCVGCCFEIEDRTFCHICGAYPAQRS